MPETNEGQAETHHEEGGAEEIEQLTTNELLERRSQLFSDILSLEEDIVERNKETDDTTRDNLEELENFAKKDSIAVLSRVLEHSIEDGLTLLEKFINKSDIENSKALDCLQDVLTPLFYRKHREFFDQLKSELSLTERIKVILYEKLSDLTFADKEKSKRSGASTRDDINREKRGLMREHPHFDRGEELIAEIDEYYSEVLRVRNPEFKPNSKYEKGLPEGEVYAVNTLHSYYLKENEALTGLNAQEILFDSMMDNDLLDSKAMKTVLEEQFDNRQDLQDQYPNYEEFLDAIIEEESDDTQLVREILKDYLSKIGVHEELISFLTDYKYISKRNFKDLLEVITNKEEEFDKSSSDNNLLESSKGAIESEVKRVQSTLSEVGPYNRKKAEEILQENIDELEQQLQKLGASEEKGGEIVEETNYELSFIGQIPGTLDDSVLVAKKKGERIKLLSSDDGKEIADITPSEKLGFKEPDNIQVSGFIANKDCVYVQYKNEETLENFIVEKKKDQQTTKVRGKFLKADIRANRPIIINGINFNCDNKIIDLENEKELFGGLKVDSTHVREFDGKFYTYKIDKSGSNERSVKIIDEEGQEISELTISEDPSKVDFIVNNNECFIQIESLYSNNSPLETYKIFDGRGNELYDFESSRIDKEPVTSGDNNIFFKKGESGVIPVDEQGKEYDFDYNNPIYTKNLCGHLFVDIYNGGWVDFETGNTYGEEFDGVGAMPIYHDNKLILYGEINGEKVKKTYNLNNEEIAQKQEEKRRQKELLGLIQDPDIGNIEKYFRKKINNDELGYDSDYDLYYRNIKRDYFETSPKFMEFASRMVAEHPEDFIDTMSAKPDKNIDKLVDRFFQIFFPEQNKKNSADSSSERNKENEADSEAEVYTEYSEVKESMGGDPHVETQREVLETNLEQNELFSTGVYGNYEGSLRWSRAEFNIDEETGGQTEEFNVRLPNVGQGKIVLPKPINSKIGEISVIGSKGEEVDYSIKDKENSLGEVIINPTEEVERIDYVIEKSKKGHRMKDMDQDEYEKFRENFDNPRLKEKIGLPYELHGFFKEIEDLPPKEKLLKIKEFIQGNGFYDFDNGEVNEEKRGVSLQTLFDKMQDRVIDLKSRDSRDLSEKTMAGVCTDFANITVAMLREAGFVSGYLSGLKPANGVAKQENAHGTAFVVWPDQDGNDKIFAFDTTPDASTDPSRNDLIGEVKTEAPPSDQEDQNKRKMVEFMDKTEINSKDFEVIKEVLNAYFYSGGSLYAINNLRAKETRSSENEDRQEDVGELVMGKIEGMMKAFVNSENIEDVNNEEEAADKIKEIFEVDEDIELIEEEKKELILELVDKIKEQE